MRLGPEKLPYVAKQFFEIGKGEENVSLEDNLTALHRGVMNIVLATKAMKEFYQRADETGTEVARGK